MYTPDKWVILKILDENNNTIFKVLAGWTGGYLEGQSWKINSGITEVSFDGNFYEFKGYSGSVYRCSKNGYGTNNMTADILHKILNQPELKGKISLMEEQDFTNLLN